MDSPIALTYSQLNILEAILSELHALSAVVDYAEARGIARACAVISAHARIADTPLN